MTVFLALIFTLLPGVFTLLPADKLPGVARTRRLGTFSFTEVTTRSRDAEAIVSGTAPMSVGPERVTVGLYYGELTGGDARGTRVLVKSFEAAPNNALSVDLDASSEEAAMARMRQRLEQTTRRSVDEIDAEIARLDPAGAFPARALSTAEALAENEFAAHSRVQAAVQGDVERACLVRLLGRQVTNADASVGVESEILLAFPWRGEDVRMALPTSLPPTLASWASRRACKDAYSSLATLGAKYDASVPRQGLQQRGRYVRAVLHGALKGLSELHACGLVHQSLGSPGSVRVSTEDDRVGDKAKGWLMELGFCRDARSMEPVYRSGPDGEVLPAFEGTADVLDAGLFERACRKCVRPGDPAERARFAVSDDMREFGLLLLAAVLLPNADPNACPLELLALRNLCEGSFAATDEGMPTDGVDVERLREYLDAEEGLRLGGVGGVDVLDVGGPGKSGWHLLGRLLAPVWEERPTAAEALEHPWWREKMFF